LNYDVTTSIAPVIYNHADTSLTAFTSHTVAPLTVIGTPTNLEPAVASRLSFDRGAPHLYESSYDFGGAVTLDFINRMLLASQQGGSLSMTQTVDDITFDVTPTQVPYIRSTPFFAGFRGEMILDELNIVALGSISLPIVGNVAVDFDLDINARIPLTVSFNAMNEIVFTASSLPTFNIINRPRNFLEGVLFNLVEDQVVASAQSMLRDLDNIPVPTINVDGYLLTPTELTTIESPHDITSHFFLGGQVSKP
jgi:hypothetical protein